LLQAETEPDDLIEDADELGPAPPAVLYPDLDVDDEDEMEEDPLLPPSPAGGKPYAYDEAAAPADLEEVVVAPPEDPSSLPVAPGPSSEAGSVEGSSSAGSPDAGAAMFPPTAPIEDSVASDDTASARSTEL